jgi:predicted permease
MESMLKDLRFGLRMLRVRPGFTLVAMLTLAVAISANTIIFSAVNAVLLRPLSYPDPERLVLLRDVQDSETTPASYAEYLSWKEQAASFSDLGAYFNSSYSLTGEGEPEELLAVRASANLLTMLNIKPELGRGFVTADEPREAERVVMLSYGIWQRRFGKDPAILGRGITLGDQSYTVVGVLPAGVKGVLPSDNSPGQVRDIWMPLRLKNPPVGLHFLTVIGRLRPGLKIEQARRETDDLSARLRESDSSRQPIRLTALSEYVQGDTAPALLILFAAVGLVLLIGCANVANLMLARAASRRKEIAIRLALGANRMRLVRQMLMESLTLSLCSGALGVLLALWGSEALAARGAVWLPRAEEIRIDIRALMFTLILSVLTAFLFGLAPAVRASLSNGGALKEGGQRGGAGVGHDRLRSLLVVSEMALSLVVLVSAGLLIRSFTRLMSVDKGFDAHNVLALDVSLAPTKYPEPDRQSEFFEQVMERIRSLPGIESVGAVSEVPLGENATNGGINIEGQTFAPNTEPIAEKIIVSADYFHVMHIQLRSGRFLTDQDRRGREQVAVVNEAFVKNYLGNKNAIGTKIDFGWETEGWQQIVGVVGNVKHVGLAEAPLPAVYVPHLQRPSLGMTLVVRSTRDPTMLAGTIRDQVFAVDKDQPVSLMREMDEVVSASAASRRLSMTLFAGFAFVALALSSIGIYGVMSYVVTQRTQEIGVRMALGAQGRDVSSMVIRQGMTLALAGVALGLAFALLATRLLQSLLYEVSASDPVTFGSIALLLSLVALVSCYVPAHRATRVDPMVALRCE